MCKEKYCYLSLDFQTIPYLFLKHHIPDIQIKRAQWVLGFMSPSWILPSSRRQTTSLRLHRHKIKHMKSETNFLRVDRWDDWIEKTHSCEKWNVMLHKYHASPSNHHGRHHTPGLLLILHSSNYTPKYELTVAYFLLMAKYCSTIYKIDLNQLTKISHFEAYEMHYYWSEKIEHSRTRKHTWKAIWDIRITKACQRSQVLTLIW